jgi:IS4 transposase
MAVNKTSVHSVSKRYQNVSCEISLLYHLKKLDIKKLIQSHEKESSYRMRNIVKPKTSSKNAHLRYFYTLISFRLKNIWLYLQKKIYYKCKKRSSRSREDKFRFDTFLILIDKWLRKKLRVKLMMECKR